MRPVKPAYETSVFEDVPVKRGRGQRRTRRSRNTVRIKAMRLVVRFKDDPTCTDRFTLADLLALT